MIRVAVLVISTKTVLNPGMDTMRPVVDTMIEECAGSLVAYAFVPDDRKAIREQLMRRCDEEAADLVLTLGGTGVRPTDWAPEATQDVIEREIPGIGEAMRQESLKKVRTAMLSRGLAGIRGKTVIVNLPGSPKGARENFRVILPVLDHTVEKVGGKQDASHEAVNVRPSCD